MFRSRFFRHSLLTVLLCSTSFAPAQQGPAAKQKFPHPEKLTYRIEWRLITAGSAVLDITGSGANQWQTNLNVQSAGIMTRLYRVLDTYKVATDSKFCGVNTSFDAQEGKRHTQATIVFEPARHKLKYDEHDLVKNTSKHQELDIPPCTHEITGALANLRTLTTEPGKSVNIPISDGKKVVNARIETQAREKIIVDGKTYQTVRYEAYLFDNVLYRRKGRLLIWISDDEGRLPVQLRLQMGFPIGNVSIFLEKEESL